MIFRIGELSNPEFVAKGNLLFVQVPPPPVALYDFASTILTHMFFTNHHEIETSNNVRPSRKHASFDFPGYLIRVQLSALVLRH